MNNQPIDIFEYITKEETKYQTAVKIIDGWNWSMKEHITTSIFYKNGQLTTGNDVNKPVKNIILPILNLEYRAEDIDVKDIMLYVDDPNLYHLSFLVKKYHDDVFVVENDIDTFIDEEKEENIDLGAVLVKDIDEAKPDIVHLQDIAFCNQNDILSSPIGILHLYSPDELKEMESRGWGEKVNGATNTIDEVIEFALNDKGDISGKDIKIYEVHGTLPDNYLQDQYKYTETKTYSRQFHVVCFYKDDKGDRKGMVLFRAKEDKSPFKLDKRDKIHNRACGRGGIEELFEDQVWINYTQIQKKNLLDAASKVILQTDDDQLQARHPTGLKGMKNLEILTVDDGKKVGQVDSYPRNIALFDKWDEEWLDHARSTGAAQEAIMGEAPKANTPFKSVEFQSAESHSLHNYRIGKHAKFLEEIYRDWFIPYIIKQITKGTKWLSTLELDDMQKIAENLSIKRSNQKIVDKILAGEIIDPEEIEAFKEETREEFMKDNKKFIEIIKDEFKNAPIAVKINISGKQKDMASYTDKLVNVFRQIIGSVDPNTGQSALDDPKLSKLFNEIIEGAGLSPIDFGSTPKKPQLQQPAQIPQQEAPINNLTQQV